MCYNIREAEINMDYEDDYVFKIPEDPAFRPVNAEDIEWMAINGAHMYTPPLKPKVVSSCDKQKATPDCWLDTHLFISRLKGQGK